METAETVNDALFEKFKEVANEDIGCIVYVFDSRARIAIWAMRW
jgi:hypothetical protein